MKTRYSIADLLSMQIEGLPSTRQALEYRAKKEGWVYVEVPAKGGRGGVRREYVLPEALRQVVKHQGVQASVQQAALPAAIQQAQVPVVATGLMNPSALADWQRQCAQARLGLVREVQQRMASGVRKTAAVESVVADAAAGTLPTPVQGLVALANARSGGSRAVSRRSLFDWLGVVEGLPAEASPVAALAPRERVQAIPAWAGALLKLWGQPQKPNLKTVLELLAQALPAEVPCPSYSQARRFLTEQVGAVERERGRLGSRKLKEIKPFVRRDSTVLWPTDCYTADGHTFDAEVAHPDHGRPFKPEITTIMDVATRRVVGWSIDLAESGWAVLDALRMAAVECGIPALFYVDNGSGYKNALMKHETTGVMTRLGVQMTHSLPYNSQAKGIIERSHQSLWVRAAKMLPTYVGADMDDQARQRVFKLTRADVKATGQSRLLPPWETFIQCAAAVVAEYNKRPHSALGRVVDPVTLKKRHLSPDEAWAKAVASGAPIDRVIAAELDDQFRPYALRKVARGEVKLFGNIYFSRELEQYHGAEVSVGYDIHDPHQVWVRDDEGRLIAKAEWNANRAAYFAKSVVEQARERRAQGRLRRLAAHRAEVLEELSPQQVIEHQQSVTVPLPTFKSNEIALAELAEVSPALPENVLPFRRTPIPEVTTTAQPALESLEQRIARWLVVDELLQAGREVDPADVGFWNQFQKSKAFRAALLENEELHRRVASAGNV